MKTQLDPAEQKCVDDIEKHGHHVMLVFADKSGATPQFGYSIGFPSTLGQPEVLVTGLDFEVMHSMINEIYRQCVAGLVLSDGAPIHDLIAGQVCIAKRCTHPSAIWYYLGFASWYHRTQHDRELTDFYQITWPDSVDGRYPWESDASPDVIAAQPLLYEAAE